MKLFIFSLTLLLRLSSVSLQRCPTLTMTAGDGIDNDCDGRIDEEICYNGVDEDSDGRFNEDCAAVDSCSTGGDTRGREFVVMFMENKPDKWSYDKLELYIAVVERTNEATNVIFETPAWSQGSRIPPMQLVGSETKKVLLNEQLRVIGTNLTGKALHVRADREIQMYGINKETFTTDGFLAIPTDGLGTDYYAVTYAPAFHATEIGVASLYDNTILRVRFPSYNGIGEIIEVKYGGRTYRNNEELVIPMSRFQALQLQTKGDLTGTRLTSNLPVSAFSGNVRTWVRSPHIESRSRDHLVEQLPPTTSWGKDFIGVYPVFEEGVDHVFYFKIVAREANTRVRIYTANLNGVKNPLYIEIIREAGGFIQWEVNKPASINIAADQPVLVMQLIHSQDSDASEFKTDPSMFIIPPVNQWDQEYAFMATSHSNNNPFTNYVIITVERRNIQLVRLDGDPIATDSRVRWFHSQWFGGQETAPRVPGSTRDEYLEYSVGVIEIAPGKHRIQSSQLFSALLYGRGDRESYAFPLGFRTQPSQCTPCPQRTSCDSIDNDCDGSIDEEICDGLDNDRDGRVDEDCNCTEPKPTPPEPKLPDLTNNCMFPNPAGKECRLFDVVFYLDFRAGGIPNQADWRYVTEFMQSAVDTWGVLEDGHHKYSIIIAGNDEVQFNMPLTNDRNLIAENLFKLSDHGNEYILTEEGNAQSIPYALRRIRTHVFAKETGHRGEALKRFVYINKHEELISEQEIANVRYEVNALDQIGVRGIAVIISGSEATAQQIRSEITVKDKPTGVVMRTSILGPGFPEVVKEEAFLEFVTSRDCNTAPAQDLAIRTRYCWNEQVSVTCPAGQRISLLYAHFGRAGFEGEKTCGDNPLDCDALTAQCPYTDLYNSLTAVCNGRPSCQFKVDNDIMRDEISKFKACQTSRTYLQLGHVCLDKPKENAISTCSFTPLTKLVTDYSFSASSQGGCRCSESSFYNMFLHPNGPKDNTICDISCPTSGKTTICAAANANFEVNALFSWCSHLEDATPWIQLDLGAPYTVLGILVQGRRRFPQWVTQLRIETTKWDLNPPSLYSDKKYWDWVVASNGSLEHRANVDSHTPTFISFGNNKTMARIVRVHIDLYELHPSMHFEVVVHGIAHGCPMFPGKNSNLTDYRANANEDFVVRCLGDSQTARRESSYTTFCSSTGTWTRSDDCLGEVRCPDIPVVSNAIAEQPISTKVGARIQYTCTDGTQMIDRTRAQITCGSDARWSSPPQCRTI